MFKPVVPTEKATAAAALCGGRTANKERVSVLAGESERDERKTESGRKREVEQK